MLMALILTSALIIRKKCGCHAQYLLCTYQQLANLSQTIGHCNSISTIYWSLDIPGSSNGTWPGQVSQLSTKPLQQKTLAKWTRPAGNGPMITNIGCKSYTVIRKNAKPSSHHCHITIKSKNHFNRTTATCGNCFRDAPRLLGFTTPSLAFHRWTWSTWASQRPSHRNRMLPKAWNMPRFRSTSYCRPGSTREWAIERFLCFFTWMAKCHLQTTNM